ncbi:MAG: hypothetical protein FJ276_18250 [Planctomycetes bacterium]|nr:hypothetical protein [Planctomycetota bacterium]
MNGHLSCEDRVESNRENPARQRCEKEGVPHRVVPQWSLNPLHVRAVCTSRRTASQGRQALATGQGNPFQVDCGRRPLHGKGETSDPIVYQFVNDQQMRSFVHAFENDAKATVVRAPKLTLYEGQTALIGDASQRPFVTDVQQVIDDGRRARQPVVKALWEGTKVQLSQVSTPDGHRVDFRVMVAAIKDCRVIRSPRHPDAEDVWIQHPVASTNRFDCSVDIPAGRTLLDGGLCPAERAYDAPQSTVSRLLGSTPKKVVREEMTYIAITPRTAE